MQNNTRHLKIFISSTFKDMEDEREILLKETFLELKKIAKERDVEITEIDLRTGITEEQEKSGKIVQICLDEIERCSDSPIFFLGMIGSRYGWNGWYESMDKSILENEKYSWVEEYKNISVTELEILSALRGNHNKAFIFLKETKDDENIKLYNMKNKLEKIGETDKNVKVEFYKDGLEFKEQTIKVLTEALDKVFPINRNISEVEKLRVAHRAFSYSRQRIYKPHIENEKILTNFIEGEEDKLLLYGESGYGKSALISNYFNKFRESNDTFVIEHYIGSGGEHSSDFYGMLRRIMLEIKEKFLLEDEVPSESQKIINEFSLWLQKVISPTIVILDGYNQLDNEMKDKLFYYLPKKLTNVKLIVTSIKDDYLIDNKQEIEALSREEQRVLVVDYMASYGKTLEDETIEKLLTHNQINNTLFLKVILNEIRLLGDFKRLSSDIDEYLKSIDTIELFSKIFKRFEKDYGLRLTKNVLVFIYLSRDGLSETNLMELLEVNRAKFSFLFLALREHLVDSNGLYKFFHAFIEEVQIRTHLATHTHKHLDSKKLKSILSALYHRVSK
jgi:GTPase SAR1 family protein